MKKYIIWSIVLATLTQTAGALTIQLGSDRETPRERRMRQDREERKEDRKERRKERHRDRKTMHRHDGHPEIHLPGIHLPQRSGD